VGADRVKNLANQAKPGDATRSSQEIGNLHASPADGRRALENHRKAIESVE